MENKISAKKKLSGVVVSMKSAKTIKVNVENKMMHPIYKKIIKQHKDYLVHYEGKDELQIGDRVMIEEGKPISKSKTFYFLKKIDQ